MLIFTAICSIAHMQGEPSRTYLALFDYRASMPTRMTPRADSRKPARAPPPGVSPTADIAALPCLSLYF